MTSNSYGGVFFVTIIGAFNPSVFALFRTGTESISDRTTKVEARVETLPRISAAPGPAMKTAAAAGFDMIGPDATATGRLGERSPESDAERRAETDAILEKAGLAPRLIDRTHANPDNVVVGQASEGHPVQLKQSQVKQAKIKQAQVTQDSGKAAEYIETYADIIARARARLAEAINAADIAIPTAWKEAASKKLEHYEMKAKDLPEFIRIFQQELAQFYSIYENIPIRKGNGRFEWGIFTVRSTDTGDLYDYHIGDAGHVEVGPGIRSGKPHDDLR